MSGKKGNKTRKFKMPPRFVLLILAVICGLFIFFSVGYNFGAGPIKTITGYVVVPVEKALGKVADFFEDKFSYFRNLDDLKDENEELKNQIDELTDEINSLKIEEAQLEEMKSLLGVDEEYSDYEKVAANVVAKDSGNWFSTFTIDKGKNDGITEDMNVIADGGLVGIVTFAGNNFSTVRAIIDDTSNVSAKVVDTKDLCIVSGDLELMNEDRVISITNILDEDDEVEKGAYVVTSNVSDKYLPNLRIGYITSLSYDSNNLTKSGTIMPTVDFNHLDMVLVILETKETTDEES